jgi:hypothetical protein
LASKGKQVDSLIYFYDARIDLLNGIVDTQSDQLAVAQELIGKQSEVIADYQAKLSESERKRQNLKRILIVSGGVIGIELILILF